ncbi:putative L-ascorbate oxidase [Mycena vulgaris]|nr:putative L-ascorbate oxidase [Mycena vulgaris]
MLPLTLLASLATASAYIWPSPQLDALESRWFNQDGHNNHGAAPLVQPCNSFIFGADDRSGRSNAADWIRTAYHDMATHNVADGTGGMDASIRFAEEQARGENAGDGFSNTLAVLSGLANRYVSTADALALGAIIAIEGCAGPEIAFRGGPIRRAFARQGFTQSEMIGLVACGHTFGGVQHAPFPDIVPELGDADNTQSVAHFDSTFVHFDNNIATEYVSGTTQNPLVVGLNDTTNSDKRIFGSDGNATTLSFADSPEVFASTCADLFARMIDTVPRGVELTEVITPLPVKPSGLQLTLAGDTLKLAGEVRFWNMAEDADRTVRLLWDDHDTPFLSLDPAAGITRMRFTVNSVLEDQGGAGFAVQDGVLFSETSCLVSRGLWAARIDVAVRVGVNPTRVYLEQELRDEVGRPFIAETDIAPPAQAAPANAAYSIWSIVLDHDVSPIATYSIGAEVDGVKIATNDAHEVINLPLCAT